MKIKIALSLLLGTIVSALALYFAVHNVPFDDLWIYLKTIDYFWILPSTIVILLAFGLRAVRWQIILNSSYKVDFWTAFHPLMIGFTINSILPGRVGEIARPVILSQKEKIPFSTGLATVATERTLDIITLIVLFALVLLKVQPDPNFTINFGGWELSSQLLKNSASNMAKLCIILVSGIVLVSIDGSRKMINNIIGWIPGQLAFLGKKSQNLTIKISQGMISLIDNFASGFTLIKKPKELSLCLGTSLVIWILNGLSYYVFALGCKGIGLSFIEIFTMMVIICFFIALPSVPGYWGIWEAGGVFALSLFGVGANEAAGYTLASHAIQIIPVMLVGMISAWITSVDIFKVSYHHVAPSEQKNTISGPAREVRNE
ncbi:MAG: lysylphosphatidylglycerol synthase transmembrane domain-containing protein [Desulfobacteraceae bacterium]|jgi:uncharacterized protein (TIRG00374 family)